MGLVERWERFWLAPASLAGLGAFRIVILSLALYAALLQAPDMLRDAEAVALGTQHRGWSPLLVFELLGLAPIGPATARTVLTILITALGLGIIGLGTRLACLIAAVLSCYCFGLDYSFGKPHHEKVALSLALLALPLAPVGARLSLDALIARLLRIARGGDPLFVPTTSAGAAFPIRITQVTVAIGYLFAGGSKIAIGGLEWLNGYTLQGIMLGHDNAWSLAVAQHLWLARLLSVGLIALQVTFPLVLWFPRLAWLYVPGALAFHLGTWATMDTGPYMTLWGTLVCFVPLERVGPWLAGRPLRTLVLLVPAALAIWVAWDAFAIWLALALVPLGAMLVLWLCDRARITIVWDGGCGICRKALACLLFFDWARRIEVLDVQKFAEVRARFPALDEGRCIKDIHSVSAGGVTRAGYATYQALAWRLPLVLPFAWVMGLPGVAWVGRRVYRHMADARLTTTCVVRP